MAEKTYNVQKRGAAQLITNQKKYYVLDVAAMSDEDFVIVSQLTTVDTAKCIDLSDAAEFAVTISESNKVTIDAAEGAADDHVLILVVGD